MWFALGFISLFAIAGVSTYRRLHAAWGGIIGHADSHEYQYRILRSQKGEAHLYLGIEGPAGFDFTLRHERWYDRLAKAVGLTVEEQTGDTEFDRAIYLVSDDLRVRRPLSDFSELRADLLDLTRPTSCDVCLFDHLRCSDRRLWVRYVVPRDFPEKNVAAVAADVVSRLARLSGKLASSAPTGAVRWHDPFVRRSAVILGLSTGLLVNGIVQLIRIGVSDAFTVDEDELVVNAIALTILATPTLLLAWLVLLGRTARAHLVLFEFALIGTIGLLLSSTAMFRDMNMELDQSPPIAYTSTVTAKRIIETRRSTSYRIALADWTGEGTHREFQVRRDIYSQFAVGDVVDLLQRQGYLGLRWVDGLHLNDQAKP